MYPLLKKWKCPSLEKSNHSSEFCVSHSFLFILVLSHLYVCLYIPHQLANYLMKMFCLRCLVQPLLLLLLLSRFSRIRLCVTP